MEYLITTLWGGMDMIYFYFFQSAFLTAKKPPKQRVVVFLIAWIIALVYTFLIPEQLNKL